MSHYYLHALIAVTILAFIHVFASKATLFEKIWHTRFLSMAGGIAIAYVFVELMPKLGVSQEALKKINADIIPLKERHVYLVSFLGFLFFLGVDSLTTANRLVQENAAYILNMISYTFLNFLVGYEIVDMNDPFIQPLYLFTIAIGVHYFIIDHTMKEKHTKMFSNFSRYVLALSLYLGFIAGYFMQLPRSEVIYAVAFVAGGMILNVMRHELLTNQHSKSFIAFAIGGIFYAIILVYQG